MKYFLAFFVTTLLFTSSAVAQFTTIPGLNTTGVDGGGALLPNGAIDGDWNLTAAPSGWGPTTYAGDPIPPNWLANTPTSRWITPDPVGTAGAPGGIYDFTYNFDLTGFDETTTVLDGMWASDNWSSILVNGASTGISHSGGATAFLNWDTFAIDNTNATFNPGLNSITFRVNNAGGPTGLHVGAFNGRAVQAVPEPATAGLLGVMAVAGLFRRRRKPMA